MKKLTQIGGFAGLVALSLGIVVELVQHRFSALVIFHLFTGAVLVVLSIIFNFNEIKEFLTKRSARLGPQKFIQGILLLVIIVFGNILIFQNDLIKDFTNRHLYTLSTMSIETVENLPGTIDVIAFMPGGGQDSLRQRLHIYSARSTHFNLRFVDPDKNEDLARSEQVPTEIGILFKYGEKRVWINKFEESDITNALIKVTRKKEPKVWFVTGHGEPGLDSKGKNGLFRLQTLLQQQGYHPEKIDLTTVENVPEDVSMVALVGMGIPPTLHEIKVLDYYLAHGGNLIIFLDPVFDKRLVTNLEYFLQPFGIEAKWNIIIDPIQHMADDKIGVKLIVTDFNDLHPITEGLSQRRGMFYLTRSFAPSENATGEVAMISLVNTSKDSYEKVILPENIPDFATEADRVTFMSELFSPVPKSDQQNGSFSVGIASSRSFEPPGYKSNKNKLRHESRIVAFGSSAICRNSYIYMPYNHEIVMNSFNWLAGENDLKFIKSPRRIGTRIYLDDNQKNWILYFSVMILPEIFMIVGLGVWWRRR
jgi:gliding motility-associatede transport system auxiliary component